ncbi:MULTISPECIES: DUF1302 domain-containing protein [Comamonadaceae]|uniref:DUF1302 domain-containing protein n=1 Tax=Comamonadaceae TaxID=80864 RepID=UPI002721B325|nr:MULTISPECIES: DUF1302 family protein [Comamonadaceae]MDO9143484.1 DUF1302 family protein [Rhodoferax sp.]MDP3884967.1 DUF1302 family protein [Hydrogenophaga sp.]
MKTRLLFTPVAAAVLALTAGAAAHAGETIEFENGAKLEWRVNANYTLAQRMESPDAVLAASAAGNDGNNNFAKGALTANRLALLFESKLSKGDSGFVLSASSFYDAVYHGTNDNNPSAANPNRVSKPAPFNEFTNDTKRYHGGYSRILDAYGYTSFNLGDTSRATVRLGRHVVNWGEALYFPNIAAAQGPFDGTKAAVPGTEVKDSILPEDQISASFEISPRWTVVAQAQYGFHETLAPAAGSFMSTSDVTGNGAVCAGVYFGSTCFGMTRQADIVPGDTGQWGIGTRFRVTDETEAGLYYLSYNDRMPLPIMKPTGPTTGSYNIRYHDDVKMLAGTVSTTFGSFTTYGEVSLRKDTPILVGALGTPQRADATQINIGTMYNVGRTSFADAITVLGELSSVKYSNYGVPESGLTFKTDSGLAFAGTVALSWPGIFEGWDLSVPISYSRQLDGRTLIGTSLNGEKDERYSIGATFTRRGNLSLGVTYLGYNGSASTATPGNRLSTDRDQLSFNAKYSF